MKKQCKSTNTLSGRHCQGITKHQGPHWAYGPDGWLYHWKNKNDTEYRWAIEIIPPTHQRYIHPKDKIKEHYRTKQ